MKRAVVIGSGMGGLTSAILLAKRGFEVTVLEQHYRPGGFLHRFFRKGQAYDTGFHYCGGIEAGQPLGQVLRHLGIFEQLNFHALDRDGFDRLQFPGFSFDVPVGWDAFTERLCTTFPHEAAGIRTVTRILQEGCAAYGLYRMEPLADLGKVLELESMSLSELTRAHITDPRCLAVLAGQSVLYGVPPEEAPVGVHAVVMDHFLSGAWSIEGGGDKLAMSLVRRLKSLGGTLRLKTAATYIDVTDRHATAVHTSAGDVIEADLVVSNLHPRLTLELLPETGAVRPVYRMRIASQQVAWGHIGVYLELDRRADMIGNRNLYRNLHQDVASAYQSSGPDGVHLYFACAPSEHREQPREDRGVVLAIAPLAWEKVAAWADSTPDARPQAYIDFKKATTDAFVRQLTTDLPGLEGHITRIESSTPLSTVNFTRSPEGSMYGHYHSVKQMGRYRPMQVTRVKNLVLVGHGVSNPGVLGAGLSAYYAMGALFGRDELFKELREA